MKQLLIVNSAKALDAGLTSHKVEDLSGLQAGAITFFELDSDTALDGPATKNFAIALGKAKGSPFMIPEVDVDTLSITKTLPSIGKKYKRAFTISSSVKGTEYTIFFVKKNTVPNQRSRFTISVVAKDTTAANLATALKNAIDAKVNNEFNFTATVASAKLTLECNNVGEHWNIVLSDGLSGTTFSNSASDSVDAIKAIGDKDYVADLASQCAAGKGFNLVSDEGKEIYPGYPEAIEDLTPNASGDNGASTAGYVIFNLHFATKRDFGKQMDERVWQNVHIAVPMNMESSGLSAISAILPEGKYSYNVATAIADAAIADAATADAATANP